MSHQAAVAILNWNGQALLQQFLPSVLAHCPKWARVVVVDNQSSDNSVPWLRAHYPEEVEVLVLEANYGFCGGYNRALARLPEEWVVLLNSDVETAPGWLEALAAPLRENPKTLASTAKILSYQDRGRFDYAGAAGGYLDWLGFPFCRGRLFYDIERDHGQYDQPAQVLWGSGACLMVRRQAFLDLGGFDERYFAHMEEIDFCWRATNLGWQIALVPQAVVYHVGGATLSADKPQKTFLNFRNSLATLYKNTPHKPLAAVLVLRLLLDGLAALFFLAKGQAGNFLAVLKGHLHCYRWWLSGKLPRNGAKGSKALLYPRSVVLKHFLGRKERFQDLEW